MTNREYRRRLRAKREYRRRLLMQRLMGLMLLLISALAVFMSINSVCIEDKDCAFLFLTVPMGLYMLFKKEVIEYEE